MSERLTKKSIDAFEYNGASKDIRWDTEISGLGVRIYESGKKAFILSYRQAGKKRLFTIGRYGSITLEQAREIARKRMGEVADGKDPLEIKKAYKKKHQWTTKKAFNDFLKRYAKQHNKHWAETQRIFEKDVLPYCGKKPIDEVTKEDIIKILDRVADRKAGIMANRTLAAMRKFFNWCVERDLIKFSPAYKVAAPAKNRSRDRVLSDKELKEIWQGCNQMGYPYGPLIQILILTGQRRGEVASMRWQDYDKEKQLWVIPREFTKADREHYVPLSDMAIEIVESMPLTGDYIFSSSGSRPFENFTRGNRTLNSQINKERKKKGELNIPSWRIHDIRRTVASGLARLNVLPHIIEKVQNRLSEQISGIAAVYNRYEYAKEKQKALDEWAAYIGELLLVDKSTETR